MKDWIRHLRGAVGRRSSRAHGRSCRPTLEGLEERWLPSAAHEFTGLTPNSQPAGIVQAADGNLWFTECNNNALGRITPTGVVTEFSLAALGADTGPFGIVSDPTSDLLYFTEFNTGRIGAINPLAGSDALILASSTQSAVVPSGAGAGVSGITLGPDGNLWFTETNVDRVANTNATLTTINEFSTGITSGAAPANLVTGPDGALWFTESGTDQIGRITTAGTVTNEFALSGTGNKPDGITVGPDEALWFTNFASDQIGRITTAGAINTFQLTTGRGPKGITLGPDGNLWFTENGADQIGRITPTGQVTEFGQGITSGAMPQGITEGPDDNLWFTENGISAIANISPDEAPTITSPGAATFTAGTFGSVTVTATGFPAPTLSRSGGLPAGVSFTDNGDGTATLAGTPATGSGGIYAFTITAHNSTAPDATQAFTLTVNQAPAITSASAGNFTAGQAGSFQVTTTGFPVPSLGASGALPLGVAFTDNGDGTATLSGTPALGTQGSYVLTLTAHNGSGGDATQTFTLTVASAPAAGKVYVNAAFTGKPGTDPDGAGPATAIGYDAFVTIQQALNAVATGGTVVVEAGSYAEALTIARPVFLQGAGAGSTTLAGQNVARGLAGLNVTAGAGVAISGLTVSGFSAGLLAGSKTPYLSLLDVRFTANAFGSFVGGVNVFLFAGGTAADTFFASPAAVDRQGDDPIFYQNVGFLTLDGGGGSNRLFVFLSDTSVAATVWATAGAISRDRTPFLLFYQATGGTFGGGVDVVVGTGPETVVVQGQSPGAPLAVLGQGGGDNFFVAVNAGSNYRNLFLEGGGSANTLFVQDESGASGAVNVQGAGDFGEFDVLYAGGGLSRIDYLNVQQVSANVAFTTVPAAP